MNKMPDSKLIQAAVMIKCVLRHQPNREDLHRDLKRILESMTADEYKTFAERVNK